MKVSVPHTLVTIARLQQVLQVSLLSDNRDSARGEVRTDS